MDQHTPRQPAPDPIAPQPPEINTSHPEAANRTNTLLGWIATVTAVLMYVSYVSQIQLNITGHKGSAIQPLATMINCSLWVAYGLLKRVRDWLVALANAPGVILGAITFATAL